MESQPTTEMTSARAWFDIPVLDTTQKSSRFVFVEVGYVCKNMGAFIALFAGGASEPRCRRGRDRGDRRAPGDRGELRSRPVSRDALGKEPVLRDAKNLSVVVREGEVT
jgi:hypothetical protein